MTKLKNFTQTDSVHGVRVVISDWHHIKNYDKIKNISYLLTLPFFSHVTPNTDLFFFLALLHLLWRIRAYLPTEARVTFYKAYIMPHFDFCSCIWGTSTDLPKLQKLQKRAIRLIFNLEKSNSTTNYMEDISLMPLKQRNEFRIATMFKTLNNLTPQYVKNMFKYIQDVHNRATRSSSKNDLYVLSANICAFKNSFAVWGAQIWNNLPIQIRKSKSLSEFKMKYPKCTGTSKLVTSQFALDIFWWWPELPLDCENSTCHHF